MRWVSHVLQRLAAALWTARTTPAVLRTAERAYTVRRRALIDALGRRGVAAHGRTGMNVWVPVPEEAVVVQALLQAGWAVAAGERFRLRARPGIRVTVSTLAPDEADPLAEAIASALRPRRAGATA
jgi:DNA-binding transcriptional MocR family regulator